MQDKPLRIGVIGVGFGTVVQIPGFQSEGVEVAAVCARREDRAREAAERFQIPNVFTDYEEMVKADFLDAVSIVSPVPLHYPMTIAALNAGKHVLCEKPFTLNQGEAKELWEKSKALNLTTMITHEFRFASGRMRVKELIDQGYLGSLHMAKVSLVNGPRTSLRPRPYTVRDDLDQGGGFLSGLGSHYIDCLRHWFGEVTSVQGYATTHLGERIIPDTDEKTMATADDTFNFTLEFASGGWATMTGTTAAPFGPGGKIEIYGSNGALVTPHQGAGVNPPPHGTILGAQIGDEELRNIEIPDRLQPFADDRDDRLMPFRLLVREFLRGIQDGTSPAPNFYDGFRCQQVLDAVRESSMKGLRVDIDIEV